MVVINHEQSGRRTESVGPTDRVGAGPADLSEPEAVPLPATAPTVSLILPTLNERAHLRDCLDSLAAQDYPYLIEIIVSDGGSRDGTRELAARYGHPVRLVDNPRMSAAAGLNVAWRAARAEIIVRADAHALYAPDYVRRCVDVLTETGADNVGGAMRAVGTTVFGRAVAAVTSTPFGVGPGRFHYSNEREEVDTVYLGSYRRATLERLGGWDENGLQWAAEDHELNFRLTRAGGRILLDPMIRSIYFPRETWRGLARQYLNYGTGKVSTLAKHGALPTWRPLAPAAMVAGCAASLLGGALARRPAVAIGPIAIYALAAAGATTSMARAPGVSAPHAFAAMTTCHWAYGLGFWRGVGRLVTRRGFDARPRRGRR
jgi:GT2 family glycosyltransferase